MPHYHFGDLPEDITFEGTLAVDTEAMGLNIRRDPLCVVQIKGQGDNAEEHVVQLDRKTYDAPRLKGFLEDPKRLKIYHYARFDVAAIWNWLHVLPVPLYCTRTASKIARTYTQRHGLRDLCHEILRKDISKKEQTSDWGQEKLTQSQVAYAANDVRYLHVIKEKLDAMLERECRSAIAKQCFDVIATFAQMDALGMPSDLFEH